MNQPVNLVILGASGDLTKRLLLPGLGTLLRASPTIRLNLIGAADKAMADADWQALVKGAMQEGGCSGDAASSVAQDTRFLALDATSPDEMRQLFDSLEGPIVLYCALPPKVTMKVCAGLKQLDIPDDLRIAVEKPFGTDLKSAQEFNKLLKALVPEDRVFRVDHFLGKATVLNLLGLRFANRIFEPFWNAQNIERVEIITDESLALEGRAGYYDHAGALQDMIQSHLLLVMAMFAMEEPAAIDSVEVRDLIAHVLRSTHVLDDDPVTNSRRARYTAGTVNGEEVPNYTDEPGVDPANDTETLVEVTLEIRNSRWSGVPFRLRSGKALGDGLRAITVMFRPVSYLPRGLTGDCPRNVLSIGMTPETLMLQVATNAEGGRLDLESTVLAAELGDSPIRPYGQILGAILDGDPLLSVRGDIAEDCWRILTPVIQAWKDGRVPLAEYRAGSSGPVSWD